MTRRRVFSDRLSSRWRVAVLAVLAGLLPLSAYAEDDRGEAAPTEVTGPVEASVPAAPEANSSPAQEPAPAARPDLAPFRDAMLAYRRGDVSGGERLHKRNSGPV